MTHPSPSPFLAALCLAWACALSPAFAAPPKGAPKSAEAPRVDSVSAAIARFKCAGKLPCAFPAAAGSVFDGLRWGMTKKEVIEAYTKPGGAIDREYDPILARMQPGRAMSAKEAERDEKKRAFESSFIAFKETPTGLDASPLRGEYTYRNRESLLSIDVEGGKKRYFFFIGASPAERLWKVYEEVPVGDGTPLGRTYQDAVASLSVYLAAPGRVRAIDEKDVLQTTVDWDDDKSRLRAVDRGVEHLVGIVLEDKAILGALPQLRANKAEDVFAMDPSVQSVTQNPPSDPNAEKKPDPAQGVGKPKKR